MGLPHRNSSVLKQARINEWKVKGRIRMDPRIREGDKGGGGLTGTRASEAKGPFPGGKRVGSWGKKREMVGITLRGLGVGGRKKIVKANIIEKNKSTKVRSYNREQIFGVVLVEYKQLALQRH